eukprot:Protomagalhaensia_sp_Gyna_25__4296@NODE_3925_length_402_cov_456_730028_g3358_i0_p1_GENE_NODE_3925_length_402_cov_456_730028_g3358_i0NODE_3925_length_402_cov_456_730028_g3358_i0_p1_ORF_typecomplete_len107_score4_54DUF2423/PF10338_9/3_3e07Laps/PF10169_9/0_066_NODE_3925_length_402_cov_456_730028_g3358_i081365
MAKSIRSKVKRKWRAAKRRLYDKTIEPENLAKKHASLVTVIKKEYKTPVQAKNAFLHPNDPEAVIPQVQPRKLIDFRCENLIAEECLLPETRAH